MDWSNGKNIQQPQRKNDRFCKFSLIPRNADMDIKDQLSKSSPNVTVVEILMEGKEDKHTQGLFKIKGQFLSHRGPNFK